MAFIIQHRSGELFFCPDDLENLVQRGMEYRFIRDLSDDERKAKMPTNVLSSIESLRRHVAKKTLKNAPTFQEQKPDEHQSKARKTSRKVAKSSRKKGNEKNVDGDDS